MHRVTNGDIPEHEKVVLADAEEGAAIAEVATNPGMLAGGEEGVGEVGAGKGSCGGGRGVGRLGWEEGGRE